MVPSLYSGILSQDVFNRTVVGIVSKYTDPDSKMPLLHKLFLSPEFSATGTFASISELVTNFMVDVIATDSKLPLKNTEAISLLNGFLPKMGNEMFFNEQQLQDLDTMMLMSGMPLKEILLKLLKHADLLLKGGLLRNEYIFLQGLSTGKAIVNATDNVGVEFECNYNFIAANKTYATVAWGGAGATPMTDLRNKVDQALNDGIILSRIFMNYKTFSQIMSSDEVKGLIDSTLMTRKQLEDYLTINLGLKVYIVNRIVTAQINNVNTSIQAWADGQITLTTDDELGKLVWTRTAEFNHRVPGVMYTDADSGVFLLSKYGSNNPVTENTSIQGRCLPVISNVQNIYQLDTTKTSA